MPFLVPLASLIAVDAWGLPGAIAASVGAGACAAFLGASGHVLNATFLAAFALGGILAGWRVRRGGGAFAAITLAALPPLMAMLGAFELNFGGFHTIVTRMLGEIVGRWKSSVWLPPQAASSVPTLQDVYLGLFPLWVALAVLASSAIVYAVAGAIVPIFGRPPLTHGRFRTWRMPYPFVWLLILGLFLILTRRPPFTQIGVNMTVLLATGYALAGLAIVRYFLIAWALGSGLQTLILTMLFVVTVLSSQVPLVPAFAVALGFLDTWVDFRGLASPPLHGRERPIHH